MADLTLYELSRQFLADCRARGWTVATAESCTGGLIAAALTEIPGSSDVVDCGFVTYSNQAKVELIQVPAETLEAFGAVSEETARAMAIGAKAAAKVDLALSVTGIAGPGGATTSKPVGLVHFAAAGPDGRVIHHHEIFAGDRSQIRAAAVLKSLTLGWRMMGLSLA
jgi:nicotinamide-nucleotide amidase